MPTYVFRCLSDKCAYEFERQQGIEDAPPRCPICDSWMYKVPVIPAKTTVGKYGKGGGKC